MPNVIDQLLCDVRKSYGDEAHKNLVLQLSCLVPKEVREALGKSANMIPKVRSFIYDPAYQEKVTSGLSKTHRTILERQVKKSWRSITDRASQLTVEDILPIKKAIRGEDWNKLVRAHVPESNAIADHAHHTANNPQVNQTLAAVISNPANIKPMKNPDGIARKLVYAHPQLQDQYAPPVMVKPYHKKLESHTRGYVNLPITGWATMATKKLFDAGGIGHLAEDVHAMEHGGIPVTVHSFARNFDPIHEHSDTFRSSKLNPNPLSVGQIALVDYLTNNSDRHAGNLMASRLHTDDEGYDALLAIDHERNFQYKMNPSEIRPKRKPYADEIAYSSHSDKPYHYVHHSPGLHIAARQARDAGGWDNAQALAQWWKDKSPDMRVALDNELKGIKDEKVKEHIRSNFKERADKLDLWASRDEVENPLQEGTGAVQGVHTHKMPSKHMEEVNAVMQHIKGADPYDMARSLLAQDARDKYKGRKKEVMQEVLHELVSKMSPEQVASFLDMNHGHGNINVRKAFRSRTMTPQERDRFSAAMLKLDPHRRKFPAIHRAYTRTMKAG